MGDIMRQRDLKTTKHHVALYAKELRKRFKLKGIVRIIWCDKIPGWDKPWPLASTRAWEEGFTKKPRYYTIHIRKSAVGNRDHALSILSHEFAHVLKHKIYGHTGSWHDIEFYKQLCKIENFMWNKK